MPREKTSQAEVYSARLNPINPHEKEAIRIIREWEAQGVNFKQLAVDRILRGEGFTPDMFDREPHTLLNQIEEMFERFAKSIAISISNGDLPARKESQSDEEYGAELQRDLLTLARGLGQRRRSAGEGDDDE